MAIARENILEIARSLPPGPRVFAELDRLLGDSSQPVEEIAAVIKRDAALVAHLIRVSNSVAFGGEQKAGSIEEAVARLGFVEIHRLVGEVAVARLADRELKHYGIAAEDLRAHLLHTAFVCEQLALGGGLDARRGYTAGLMRALGLLVLDRVADRYAAVERYQPEGDSDYAAWEGRLFGFGSCEVAAMVLAEWRFPTDIIEAVRDHHLRRSADLAQPFACIVHLAAAAVTQAGQGLPGEAQIWGVSHWKLDAVGLNDASYLAAVARAREAYDGFIGKKPGATETEVTAETAVAAPGVPAADTPEVTADSCNFEEGSGVLTANDAPPVHTTEAGLTAATDFTTFMRNYQDMVFSTAARLTGNDAQAEDISQEVFLKAYEHYDRLGTSPTAGGWLKTVATNLSLNHLSRYRNRWRFFSEFKRDSDSDERDAPEMEFAAPDTFFNALDAADRRAAVEQALAKLPPHQRVPLVLYHFEELPYEEIAKKTGVSLAKVKTDILRARAALAKILTRGGTPESISLSTP